MLLDDASGNPRGTDPETRRPGTGGDGSTAVVTDSAFDEGDDRGLVNAGLAWNRTSDPSGDNSFAVGFGELSRHDDDDELAAGDANEHELSFSASSEEYGALDVDLSPWAPLLGMLDSTEPEASPGDRPFTPSEGVEGAHALELRAESMLQYAERGAQRTGELDRTEVGLSDDNRDVVAGRDNVEVDGMLDEHTGHGLVVVADDVEMNVGGPLTMHAHLEDNIIMAGVMRDEFAGGTLITAAMSDDMAAGLGLRCTAPLDVWVHGLVGMEERPGTCAADGILLELAGTLYEREYGPSAHVAAVARHSGTVVTTMKTGFRPLMKTALGVRNLIPGGGGGGGSASASPPAAPPAAPPGGEAGAATLTAAEGGGSLARGAAGGDDTDEVVSVVRILETASDAGDVEDLQHPASTADNLDDLARVDAEGGGYQQVAEAYEQPLPASAASEPDAGPVSGADSASPASGYKKAPELDLTEPGADGYTFQNSYGKLREQVEHHRADSNWRGNLFSREYLKAVDDKASELFTELGGTPAAVAGDNRGYRTSNIYAAMEQMAAAAPEGSEQLAKIRNAMEELQGFVHGSAVDFATRTDEFAGTALGSQRLPIDPNIDTDKLRRWLQDQSLAAEQDFAAAMSANDQAGWTRASWKRDFYDQALKSLDAGMNPLAESAEQTIFIQAAKVIPENEKYIAQATADLIELGLDPSDFDIIPPRAADQDQLDAYLEFHDDFVEILSNPEFHRSAADVGDQYTPALHNPGGPGPDQPGPGSLGSLVDGVDEPDVHPVVGADEPPLPDQPVADPSPGAGPSEVGGTRSRAEPPELYASHPGADGYEFSEAYDSLHKRNVFYRDDFNFRGNFFTREYLHEIDAKARKLFTDLGGAADAVQGDNWGNRTSSIYRALERMAGEADAAGDAGRAADIRAAMAELEGMVDGRMAEVAARTGEFSGAAIGSQRAPIDRHIDTAKLRRWLQEQMQNADARQATFPLDEPEASQLAGREVNYYHSLITSLDEGVNPLAVSNEQIVVIQINKVEPHRAQYADEIAAGRPYPRIQAEDELKLYVDLQTLLVSKLEDVDFHRSLDEMDLDTYADGPRRRIQQTLDRLGGDSLRPLAGGDIPPPLPAADFADGAVYVHEIRDRSFSRSALTASEEALERQAAGVAEGGASARGRAPVPDSAPPEPSLGTRRAPPDDAAAPHIDERSGRWLLEPYTGPDPSPTPARGGATPAPADGVSPQVSDVSWESGLQVSGDSEVGPAAGTAGDTDTSDLFRAPSEPEDVDPEGVDAAHHAPDANDDGASGVPTDRSDGTGGEDANPTGAVSEPGDSTATLGRGDATGPGPSGATSSVPPGTPEPVFTGAPPAGASAADADVGAAGTRSDLYGEPVSFEGRSLEGAPPSDGPRELARTLDGAEVPVEDLPRVEPDPAEPPPKSILRNSDSRPVPDAPSDRHDTIFEMRIEAAKRIKRRFNDGMGNADSVWRDVLWSGERREVAATREANARWSEFAAAQRTSAVSFSDDPRQMLYHVEYDRTVRRRGIDVDLFRGVDPPNTVDRAHAAHYVPRPRGWETTRETGFGRLAQGWNEFPFSPRERILNTLHKGEALSPDQISALESGVEGYRAAGGELSSSQYRAMVDMISDLGDQYQHFRWHMHGAPDTRLIQLIQMLDYAARAV